MLRTFSALWYKSGNVCAGILRNARVTLQGHQTATKRVIDVTPQKR